MLTVREAAVWVGKRPSARRSHGRGCLAAGSTCGAASHNAALPSWAGPSCSYAGGITRPPLCTLVSG
jgi:hypothetical protein